MLPITQEIPVHQQTKTVVAIILTRLSGIIAGGPISGWYHIGGWYCIGRVGPIFLKDNLNTMRLAHPAGDKPDTALEGTGLGILQGGLSPKGERSSDEDQYGGQPTG